MPLSRVVIWGPIWKRMVVKNQTDATSVIMQPYIQALWRHNGEKSHKCNQCEFETLGASNLRTHMKTHGGEKPNKCNECDYTTLHKSSLKIHFQKHSGKIPTNAASVTLPPLGQEHWSDIWKYTPGKHYKNANNLIWYASSLTHLKMHQKDFASKLLVMVQNLYFIVKQQIKTFQKYMLIRYYLLITLINCLEGGNHWILFSFWSHALHIIVILIWFCLLHSTTSIRY